MSEWQTKPLTAKHARKVEPDRTDFFPLLGEDRVCDGVKGKGGKIGKNKNTS